MGLGRLPESQLPERPIARKAIARKTICPNGSIDRMVRLPEWYDCPKANCPKCQLHNKLSKITQHSQNKLKINLNVKLNPK